ncbi:DUF6230 family protein [Bacillus marinisedimentorum]|uniref:DUF6230 family protein n=1 Tax=Bacillus marinisedimentorum TaxID=1821260 RepID=UPI0009F5BDBA|nr:DUF6230 family protein [Bacillus marinisedimentorum]
MEESQHAVESVSSSKINKKKFFAAFGSGFLFLGLLAAVFGMSGVAYAVPIAGVGDFYVEFDKLEGDGYTFYPKLGETSSSDSTPQGTNLIESLTIDGLVLSKEFEVTEGNWVRVEIKASEPVQITGLQHDAGSILANAQFNNLVLKEQNSTDWQKQFKQESDTIVLKDAKLKTHYLFQKTITMNGMKLTVDRIKK